MFAICWAWINFTWFASAYDTDDWFFRIATMVEMVGVIVLALGLPTVFHAIDSGEGLGNGVVVAGYVVMRLAPIALWLRVAKQDERRRPTALTYAVVVFVAQVGWGRGRGVQPTAGRGRARHRGRRGHRSRRCLRVGYETIGHRHEATVLEQALGAPTPPR